MHWRTCSSLRKTWPPSSAPPTTAAPGARRPATVPTRFDVAKGAFVVGAGNFTPPGILVFPNVSLAAIEAGDVPGVLPPNFPRVGILFTPAATPPKTAVPATIADVCPGPGIIASQVVSHTKLRCSYCSPSATIASSASRRDIGASCGPILPSAIASRYSLVDL